MHVDIQSRVAARTHASIPTRRLLGNGCDSLEYGFCNRYKLLTG